MKRKRKSRSSVYTVGSPPPLCSSTWRTDQPRIDFTLLSGKMMRKTTRHAINKLGPHEMLSACFSLPTTRACGTGFNTERSDLALLKAEALSVEVCGSGLPNAPFWSCGNG